MASWTHVQQHTPGCPSASKLSLKRVSNSTYMGLRRMAAAHIAGTAAAGAAAVATGMAAAAADTAYGQRARTIARGFVGQDTPLASAYYSNDYDWQQHAEATAPLVEAQWAGAPAAVRQAALLDAAGQPVSAVKELLLRMQADSSQCATEQQQHSHSGPCIGAVSNSAAAAAAGQHIAESSFSAVQKSPTAAPENAPAAAGIAGAAEPRYSSSSNSSSPSGPHSATATNEWEEFYQAHPAARFFKERRYLLLEFPCLAPPAQLQHVVEIGAGCGSSILPVLRVQPHMRATLSDISSTCLQQLLQAMHHLGMDTQRVEVFTADGTSPELGQRLAGCAADVALIMFTLSAVRPEGMLGMMQNAAAALRPGGLLCIRDHALYDMVQLRIPAEQCIARHLYRRGDGTLAYFYTTDELAGLAVAAGLEVVESDYACVVNRNRKTGQELRRAFVHGVFRKPAE